MTKITTDFNGSENATVRASRRKEIHDFWFGAGEAEAEGTFAGVRANINGIYDPDTANGEAFGSWLTKWNALNEPDKLLNDTLKDDTDANIFILADDTARLFTDAGVTAVSAPGNSIQEAWDDWLGDIAQIGAQSTAAARPTWGRAPKEVRNLLTNSDLAGAVAGTPGTAPTGWTNGTSTGTIVAIAADGLLGGNSIRLSGAVSGSLRRSFSQIASVVLPSTVYKFSMRADVIAGARVDTLVTIDSQPAGATVSYEIDGVAAAGADVPAAGERVLTAVVTVGATTGTCRIIWGVGTTAAVNGDVRFWSPSFTTAADASLPYQRRGATPTDVTESGVTSFGLISMDGSDDALLHQLAAGGTVSVALFGRGGSYLIPSITLAAPSVLQLGPLSVLDDGVLVSGCPTGILRAVGTVPWSSRFELVGYAIMKANPSAEEQARAMRYFAAFGARGWLVEGPELVTNGGFDTDTDWTKGTGWSIGSGVATKTAGTAAALEQAQTIAAAGVYLWTADITRSAGTLTPRFTGGTTFNGTAISAGGALSGILIGQSGNTTLGFQGDSAFAGTIDNVTLQLLTPEF